MKSQIFKYELKYWLKNPSIYFYALIFCFVAFIYFIGNTDYFQDFEATGRLSKWYNSPFELVYIFTYLNKFFLFLIPSIIGYSLYRDYNSEVYKIMYSFPISKSSYLFGKFFSTFLISVLISTLVVITYYLSEFFPGLNSDKIGPTNIAGHLYVLAYYIIPNMFIYGLLVFAVVMKTRNVFSGFGLIIGLLFVQSIIESVWSNSPDIIALLDPFADKSFAYVTQYWGAMERNNDVLPLVSEILYSRLIWIGIALVFFFVSYKNFSLHESTEPLFSLVKKGKRVVKENFLNLHKVTLSPVQLNFDSSFQLRSFVQLVKSQVRFIFKSPLFLIILGLAILSIFFMITKITSFSEMARLPETKLILFVPSIFFKVIIMLLTFLYSGILLHREKRSKINELIDITPVSNVTLLLSKFFTIVVVQIALLLCIMLCGIVIQLYNGYYDFEIGLYLKQLIGIDLINMIIWAMVAFFLHSFFKNAYVGLFLLLGFWVLTANLDKAGVSTRLFSYNETDFLLYSNMNKFGNGLLSYFAIELYWLGFGIIFLSLTYLLMVRGLPDRWRDRWSDIKARWNYKLASLIVVSVIVSTIMGFQIYKVEQIDAAISPEEQKEAYREYTANYSRYTGYIQPRIVSTTFEMDLYPDENSFTVKGYHVITNKSNQAIDTLLLKCGFDETTKLDLSGGMEVVKYDDFFQFYVLKLEDSLQVGESLRLPFEIKDAENTLLTRNSNVLNNGTFITEDIFPRIGYKDGNQILDPENKRATDNHAYAIDSDVVDFDGIISTSNSQRVLAPGRLLKSWESENRNYFHYKTEQAIKFSYGIHSGKYEVFQEEYKGVNLEVNYHADHSSSISTMIQGLKASIDYNTLFFGAYQHKDARIVEFPSSEGGHATTFGNNIPISETRFVMADNTEEGSVNLAFYIPAHELTHQWWGNQILPANAYGARMLSESITEYITLNIYRETYGETKALEFLKMQRKRYLRQRKWTKGNDPNLIRVGTEQRHIFYGKGSMAFHTLGYYLGEKKLNAILKDFLNEYKFKESPYPTSINFTEFLKESTPDSLNSLIEDWFEKHVMYKVSMQNVMVEELRGGEFQVGLDLEFVKTEKEESVEPNDWLEVKIVYESGDFEIRKFTIDEEETGVKFLVNKKPRQIVLDPNLLLIEEDIDNNSYTID